MSTYNLADLYESLADAVPADRLAVVAGDTRLTWRQLDQRANRLAHHLESRGVAAGDRVGIHAYNCAEWLEAMLAAYKIRAVPVNVNFRYIEAELRHLYDDADLVVAVAGRELAPRIAEIAPHVPALRHVLIVEDGTDVDVSGLAERVDVMGYEEALAGAPPERGFGPRSGDDLYMLYTGGTTGLPKGVMWRHEDIFFGALLGGNPGGPGIERPEAIVANAGNDAVVFLATAPMMHGGGQWVAWIALLMGGTIVLYTGRSFDADEVWRLVERERVVSVSFVGDAMGRPLAEALGPPGAGYDTSSVVTVGSGGAILSAAVKGQLRAALPGAMVLDSFGASETGANGTVFDLDGPAAGPRFTMGEHTSVLGDDLRPVAAGSGVVGRLARRGHIPLGYWKDEARTAATFCEADGVRWVIPGDHAVVEADGTITLLGRGSVSINSGGEKIFPEEVEAALKAHPDVFDAVVVGVPDERWGERVAALVLPREGAAPTLEALAAHCRTMVAGYKVPRQLHVVGEIVRSPAGKPDYRWAKALATA
ncbi:MAG: acyl-CoA synthetase [Actinomycetota bacterium]|nr:acyl-CoA synthetase [Actinomycetota bacterium]